MATSTFVPILQSTEAPKFTSPRPVGGQAPRDVVAYIKQAIQDGDRLPNGPLESLPQVRRRALIIAPQYRQHGQPYPALPSTAMNAKLIHEMLLESGYEACNIRILCDATLGFSGVAWPAREQILDSLKWLVSGTREGDIRFLHFSGHSYRLRSDPSEGKQARVVKIEPALLGPGDSEIRDHRESPQRIRDETIASGLTYFNEALITRVIEPEFGEDIADAGKIWDYELTAWLSKLPKNSTITCITDCCTSERVIDPFNHNEPTGWRMGTSEPANNQQVQLLMRGDPSPGPLVGRLSETGAPTLCDEVSDLADPAVITSLKDIPFKNRNLSHIQAHIFTLGACHPGASDTHKCQVGSLTSSFVRAWKHLSRTDEPPSHLSYNRLFEEICQMMSEEHTLEPEPQFVQLWTLWKHDKDESVRAKSLDSPVVI